MKSAIVPAREITKVPICPKCSAPLAPWPNAGKGYNQWVAECDCLEPNSWNYPNYGDAYFVESHPLQSQIGEEIVIHCIRCNGEMIPGRPAVASDTGEWQYGYCGYAHPECAREWIERNADAETVRANAHAGTQITCWFAGDAETKVAPRTGYTDNLYRPLPTDLPELPIGTVVEEWFRRPFAVIALLIPDESDAKQFWDSATKSRNASYELHWFPRGEKTESTRHFTGKGFAHAESYAAQLEIAAGTI